MSAPGPSQALHGVRVLDLSQGIAGPFAARLLGDFGAEVIKIEGLDGGDPARGLSPLLPKGDESDRSLMFAYLNWNKRGIVLNLSEETGRQNLQAWVWCGARRPTVCAAAWPMPPCGSHVHPSLPRAR